MSIFVNEQGATFHLCNREISYILQILPNGQPGQVYFGRRIPHKEDFSYRIETPMRPMSSCVFDTDKRFSLEHIRQEYPSFGGTDYRMPAVETEQADGGRITDLRFCGYRILPGKPPLPGLPATYTEAPEEAETLLLALRDERTGLEAELAYTLFAEGGVLARSVHFRNGGGESLQLTTAMSACLDLPDSDYDWIQFSGAWARERYPRMRRLEQGIQSVGSRRGHSSHNHNPFLILKRPTADEFQGEAMGFSLVYSGNFLIQAEVDAWDTARVLLGIHPAGFSWKLEPGESFQTPEALLVYTHRGLNHLSQTFHRLFQRRLARGYWRDRERPILLNNWEATYFDFTEEKLVQIARKARDCGVELFVLDDGWFGSRSGERSGLGDWFANPARLPNGVAGLARRVEALGLRFGLWFEPEMVNRDSELFRAHPDWVLQTPGRPLSHGRYQYVLDFSRREVVDHIFRRMADILSSAPVSYIKWDMNRSLTEAWSAGLPADRQGEVCHRYILGVYDLYERLTARFPRVLFESCASGGGRFDPGMLYYAPQAWTSDDSDAAERVKIQYGSSYAYPLSSMGCHVSVSPNHQLNRRTPLATRANVACFGAFGYELDLNALTPEEQAQVREQIRFVKAHRRLLQFGRFYRLQSPFAGNVTAWMVVSEERNEAIVFWFRMLNGVNLPCSRLRLQGLDPDRTYRIEGLPWACSGAELMYAGLPTTDVSSGQAEGDETLSEDFASRLFLLKGQEGA